MTYELALELKNAGFLQGHPSGDHHAGGGWFDTDGDFSWHPTGNGDVYAPTLSELIEAVPMRRKDLGTVNDAHFVLRKLVSRLPGVYWAYMEDEDSDEPIEGYSFRNEPADVVVARLYVALNKK